MLARPDLEESYWVRIQLEASCVALTCLTMRVRVRAAHRLALVLKYLNPAESLAQLCNLTHPFVYHETYVLGVQKEEKTCVYVCVCWGGGGNIN